MVCKQEPAGAKPFLSGLLKWQILYQSNATPVARAANVLHLKWTSGNNHTLTDLTSLVSFLSTNWDASIGPSISGAWFHIGDVLSSLGGDGVQATHVGNVAGQNPAVTFPPSVAVCISWKTNIVQRGGRSRTYIPGVPQNAVTTPNNAALASTYSGPLKSAAEGLINTIAAHTVGGDNVTLGTPSYYSKCQLRAVPIFFGAYDAVVHDRLDTQRRRSGKESTFPVT